MLRQPRCGLTSVLYGMLPLTYTSSTQCSTQTQAGLQYLQKHSSTWCVVVFSIFMWWCVYVCCPFPLQRQGGTGFAAIMESTLAITKPPPVWFCIACSLLLGTLVPLVLNGVLGAVRANSFVDVQITCSPSVTRWPKRFATCITLHKVTATRCGACVCTLRAVLSAPPTGTARFWLRWCCPSQLLFPSCTCATFHRASSECRSFCGTEGFKNYDATENRVPGPKRRVTKGFPLLNPNLKPITRTK